MGKCSKDKRDIYYRKAKEAKYRARSAFKLIQLDDTFSFLQGATRIVDLCAAPGGWSQVIVERLRQSQKRTDEARKIIAVDLMEMAPIEGVHQLKGDITHAETANAIISYFGGSKAHVIVMDGAPDVIGSYDWDEYIQAQLVLAGLHLSLSILEENGIFVAKIFRGAQVSLLFTQLNQYFSKVTCAKPKASRNSSFEAFVVCEGFVSPEKVYQIAQEPYLLDYQDLRVNESNAMERARSIYASVQFRGCGDVCGDDADQSYPLEDLTEAPRFSVF
ncbi:hypothetical protein ABG067_004535 [Albugo candida]